MTAPVTTNPMTTNPDPDPTGVSVVVCCYNSAARLSPTLAHLAAQQVPEGITFEVVLIDNDSSDDTAHTARTLWPEDCPFPLRVVEEPKRGLSNARQRGILEARFEFVSFVDDDNWVCPTWVHIVHDVLSGDPRLGACGGPSEGVFEVQPPDWLRIYQGNYAIGEQYDQAGDVTDRPTVLWGAGLSLRKSAWLGLRESGFQSFLTDRSGDGLTSGGDHELCLSLVLSGWRLRYDPRLRLRHFMPAGRTTWTYFRRLYRGAGWSTAWLDPYQEALGHQPRTIWTQTVIKLVFSLARNPARLARCLFLPREGHPAVAVHDLLVGRLGALLRYKDSLTELRFRIQQAPSRVEVRTAECRFSASSRSFSPSPPDSPGDGQFPREGEKCPSPAERQR